MLFMVIERFQDNDMVPIYRQVRDGGRMLPEGLKYIDSWVEPNFSRCFQLMQCDDVRLFQEWILQWRGFGVTFASSARTQVAEAAGHVVADREHSSRSGTIDDLYGVVTSSAHLSGGRRVWAIIVG